MCPRSRTCAFECSKYNPEDQIEAPSPHRNPLPASLKSHRYGRNPVRRERVGEIKPDHALPPQSSGRGNLRERGRGDGPRGGVTGSNSKGWVGPPCAQVRTACRTCMRIWVLPLDDSPAISVSWPSLRPPPSSASNLQQPSGSLKWRAGDLPWRLCQLELCICRREASTPIYPPQRPHPSQPMGKMRRPLIAWR